MLTGKGVLRAGYGNKDGKGMSRADYGSSIKKKVISPHPFSNFEITEALSESTYNQSQNI